MYNISKNLNDISCSLNIVNILDKAKNLLHIIHFCDRDGNTTRHPLFLRTIHEFGLGEIGELTIQLGGGWVYCGRNKISRTEHENAF